MKKLVSPFRVGLFALILGGVFVAIYSYLHKGGLSSKDAIEVYAIFHDASGLEKKSEVTIAGINVGEIVNISLYQGDLAKITLRIKRTVHLKTDAALTKRSASLLGDNLLEVYSGSADAPLMPEGGQIMIVNDRNGMQEIFDSLGKITKDIEHVTDTLGGTLNNEEGAVGQIVKSLQTTVDRAGLTINETLDNVHAISKEMEGVAGSEQKNVEDIVENVRIASQEAAAALKIVDKVLGANQGEMATDVKSLKDSLDKLNESLANIRDVTAKVNQGEGTLGKFVNDDSVYRKLDDTLTDASDFVGRLLRIRTQVQLHVDYLLSEATSKGYLDLRLITRPDRYYLLQLVYDNRATTSEVFNTCNPCSELQTTGITTSTTSSLKYSAEIAQKFFDRATLRLGLIESTAGGGLDVDIWKPYLFATGDLFDFGDYYQPYPRLRGYLTGQLFNHIEIRAGVDDILNNWAKPNAVAPLARGYSLGGRDVFVGGGIYFTDDDLKSVVGIAATAK